MRSGDTFAYNLRGEVASAVIAENAATYAYDLIGNSTTSTWNSVTNYYYANSLNQYVEVAAPETPYSASYSPDGELTSFKTATYGYDALSRLTVVRTNDEFAAEYAYDHLSRRVRKIARDGVHTFFYDGWNLVLELIIRPGGVTDRIEYYWGKDLSGSLQGAGGIGGLLYLKYNGAIYIPFYDAYGNILGYWNASGDVVASYTYDAFGKTISSTGPLADAFSFRYSTKYFDPETELYYYGYRYYSPELRRWITRDPIGEHGGVNLYLMCKDKMQYAIDVLGLLTCQVNPFFKAEKYPESIAPYVKVLSYEVKYENRFYDFLPFIPFSKRTLPEYHWTVEFVLPMRPKEIVTYNYQGFSGYNALGGNNELFVESRRTFISGRESVYMNSSIFWGNAELLYERFGALGQVVETAYEYPDRKFRFGYFVYRAKRKGAPFELIYENPDMYSRFYNGVMKLRHDDVVVSGQRDPCGVICVQYGDKGRGCYGSIWFEGK